MTIKQKFLLFTALLVMSLCVTFVATGATAPKYGAMPYEVGIISSTADQDILAAPGANMRWVITGFGYNVLVEDADSTVDIEDKAGTPVTISEFAPETQGFGVYYDFGEGIACSINSGVTVDFSGSTADCYIYVKGYKERAEG